MPDDGWARDDGGGAGQGSEEEEEEQSLVGKGAAASSSGGAGMTSWPQRRYIMALLAMSMWLVRTNTVLTHSPL